MARYIAPTSWVVPGEGTDPAIFFDMARYNAPKEVETMPNTKSESEGKVRCTFDLTKKEAAALCELRCEPKPSTAAAPD